MAIFGGLGGVYFFEELSRGADGAMTGFPYPEALRAIREHFVAGRRDAGARAVLSMAAADPLRDPAGRHTRHLDGIRKEILRRRGWIASARVRPPAAALDPATLAELTELLAAVAPAEPTRRPRMKATGATRLVEALTAAGVRHLFTLSGNQILSIFDATIGRGIRSHPHAPRGRGRAHGGRVGAAHRAAGCRAGHRRAPGISTRCRRSTARAWPSRRWCCSPAPARARSAGAAPSRKSIRSPRRAPVSKAAWSVDDAARVGDDIARALALATSGRPGPVHLSLPGDVLEAAAPERGATASSRSRREPPDGGARGPLSDEHVATVLAWLAEAKRPLILTGPALGRGPRRAAVQRLADATGRAGAAHREPARPERSVAARRAPLLAEADLRAPAGQAARLLVRFGQPFARDCRIAAVDRGCRRGLAARGARRSAIVADPAAPRRLSSTAAARGRAWRLARGATRWSARGRRARPQWAEWRRVGARADPSAAGVRGAGSPTRPGAVLVADGGEFGQWVQAGLEPASA